MSAAIPTLVKFPYAFSRRAPVTTVQTLGSKREPWLPHLGGKPWCPSLCHLLQGTALEPVSFVCSLAETLPASGSAAAEDVCAFDAGVVLLLGRTTSSPLYLFNTDTFNTGPVMPTVTGEDADAFTVSTETCSDGSDFVMGVAPGGRCEITVTFRPTSDRPHQATLAFVTDAGAPPGIPLQGEGTPIVAFLVVEDGIETRVLAGDDLSFPDTLRGESVTRSFRLRNQNTDGYAASEPVAG